MHGKSCHLDMPLDGEWLTLYHELDFVETLRWSSFILYGLKNAEFIFGIIKPSYY